MTQASPQLAMVAGEASGDLLSGLLLAGLKTRWPRLQSFGIGGPQMQAQGFDAWWPHDKLSVHGYSLEVFSRAFEIWRIRRALGARLLQTRPDVFVGVDAPDFNLGLEARLKAGGIKTVHFVSPSIWAWRPERIHRIGQAVDLMLCVFPFESAIYEKQGIPAAYVGHPLADAIPLEVPRAQSRAALGLNELDTVVAVLPGSRNSEIRYIAPRFAAAMALMHQHHPALCFVWPIAPGQRAGIEAALALHAPAVPVQLLDGQSRTALAACDVTLIASGTATLEAALFKRPMVIAYNMHPLSARLMRRKQLQPWVGLPNILLQDMAVPELLQDDASPEKLASATLAWLNDAPRTSRLQQRFTQLHHDLRRNTAQAATHAIEKILAG
ncbi:MAG: lipid-A-disaccharide synthase [Burkholderiales bacterium]